MRVTVTDPLVDMMLIGFGNTQHRLPNFSMKSDEINDVVASESNNTLPCKGSMLSIPIMTLLAMPTCSTLVQFRCPYSFPWVLPRWWPSLLFLFRGGFDIGSLLPPASPPLGVHCLDMSRLATSETYDFWLSTILGCITAHAIGCTFVRDKVGSWSSILCWSLAGLNLGLKTKFWGGRWIASLRGSSLTLFLFSSTSSPLSPSNVIVTPRFREPEAPCSSLEIDLRRYYPYLFSDATNNSKNRITLRGRACNDR